MNDSIKTTLAFIGGAAVGAAIGVLLAPEKGSETRKRIMTRAKDFADDITEAAKEKYEMAKDKYEELLNQKDLVLDEVEEAVAARTSKAKTQA